MRYVFDHDYHIHSKLSSCSRDEEQNAKRILRYALENDLKRICVTDHFWDDEISGASEWYKPQNFEHISSILPLPKASGVHFMFGAETEMDKNFTVGISQRAIERLDFIIVPTTHLNSKGFGISEELAATPEGRAKTWLMKLNALLSKDLPFNKVGVAHLACGLIAPKRDEYLATLDLLPEKELIKSFTRAAEIGVGIEINSYDMSFSENEAQTVLRIFEIAKHVGCKFYLGSDAHHPNVLDDAKNRFERAIDYLELKESDKFHISK